MAPGTWAELFTENINPTLEAFTSNLNILPFSDDLVWNPATREAFFIGADHNGNPRFVSYSAESNRWHIMPDPPWFAGPPFHGYDHSAIDAARGILYHRPYGIGVRVVHRYNIASATWSSTVSLDTNEFLACCVAVEYFPELNGIVVANPGEGSGSVFLFSEAQGNWRPPLATGLTMGEFQNFAEYSSVHKVMIFGGGNGNRNLYRLSSNGTVTALQDAPIALGISETVTTVDPVSGDFLVWTQSGSFYRFDPIQDEWQLLSDSTPLSTTANVVATPISNYGVNLFVSCSGNSCQAHVYKYSN